MAGKAGTITSRGASRRTRQQMEAAARSSTNTVEAVVERVEAPIDPFDPTPEELQYHKYIKQNAGHTDDLMENEDSPRRHDPVEIIGTDKEYVTGQKEAELWIEKGRRALKIPEEWIEDAKVYADSVVFAVIPLVDSNHPKYFERILRVGRGRTYKKFFYRQPPIGWGS